MEGVRGQVVGLNVVDYFFSSPLDDFLVSIWRLYGLKEGGRRTTRREEARRASLHYVAARPSSLYFLLRPICSQDFYDPLIWSSAGINTFRKRRDRVDFPTRVASNSSSRSRFAPPFFSLTTTSSRPSIPRIPSRARQIVPLHPKGTLDD